MTLQSRRAGDALAARAAQRSVLFGWPRSIYRTLGNAHNMNMILEELSMARSGGAGGDALQG